MQIRSFAGIVISPIVMYSELHRLKIDILVLQAINYIMLLWTEDRTSLAYENRIPYCSVKFYTVSRLDVSMLGHE